MLVPPHPRFNPLLQPLTIAFLLFYFGFFSPFFFQDVQLVESEEETKLFAPTPFPVYKIETGRKAKTLEEPSGVLPLVFYYTRVHKPFVKDKETGNILSPFHPYF